ncbi:MAG: hypothetical protein WB952_22045 [Terriglobales bacterium]
MFKHIFSLLLAVGFAVAPVCAQEHSSNFRKTSAWLERQQLPDGAILYSAHAINPYFANLAAIGWLQDSSKIPQVEAWMRWYIDHLNWQDYDGLYGTVYNYTYADGVETSSNTYDSADSSAATFLTLAAALYNTGSPDAQSFVQNTVGEYILNVTGNVITNLQQSNGLVVAKPDYQIEYLMDNTEDYRGLKDFAALASQAWGDPGAASWYRVHASRIRSGIQSVLYISSTGLYYPYAGSLAPKLSTFYPDAVAQLYPAVQGVVAGSSKQAMHSYTAFNGAWPGWTNLSFSSQTPFPWAVVSYAAYLNGSTSSVKKYSSTIQKKYVNGTPDFSWPFYCAEGGWFMRVNAAME